MTVTNTTLTSPLYSGNGVTTAFATGFQFDTASDIQVILRDAAGVETVQTITTNYTVSGAGNPSGGTVTMVVAPPSGTRLRIVRNLAYSQTTDYTEGTAFPAQTHEGALDKLTYLTQQLANDIQRSPRLPSTSANFPAVFPDGGPSRAGYTVRWNAVDGSTLEAVSPTELALGVSISPFAQTLLDDVDAAAARTTLGLGTTSGTNTGDQNIFSTIAVSGQSNVVADTTSDTLTLVAGTNVTITTDAATDSITINAAGGGSGTSFTRDIAQSGHGFVLGDLLYLNGSTYTKAIATSAAASEVIGIVSAVADANNFTLQFGGRVTGLSGRTSGEIYFLSPSSAGTATTTEPSTAGQISKPVYIADSTTTAILCLEMRGVVINTAGVLSQATQAEMEAGTSTTTYASPANSQFHPSSAKAWVRFTSVTTTTINASYNVASLTDNGTGDTTINFTTPFSSANYSAAGISGDSSTTRFNINQSTAAPTASAFRVVTFTDASTPSDMSYNSLQFFGDQ